MYKFSLEKIYFWFIIFTCILNALARNDIKVNQRSDSKNFERNGGDLSLWIDERQVKMFSGMYHLKYKY